MARECPSSGPLLDSCACRLAARGDSGIASGLLLLNDKLEKPRLTGKFPLADAPTRTRSQLLKVRVAIAVSHHDFFLVVGDAVLT